MLCKMDTVEFQCGNWQLQCLPDDGARISKLRFSGLDLLTARPDNFRPPSVDYSKYEIRPVYGYDDCFPTVDACKSPIDDSDIADHGHLCWLPWQVETSGNSLHCEVVEETLNIQFSRTLVLGGIYFTPPAPICSILLYDRRLPENADRTQGKLFYHLGNRLCRSRPFHSICWSTTRDSTQWSQVNTPFGF